MPVGRDLADRVGDQLHVVALQRARPHAVVAQQPLRAGRVRRHHLRRAGRAGRRTASSRYAGEQLAQDVVEQADRRGPSAPSRDRRARPRARRRPSSRRSRSGSTRCTTARARTASAARARPRRGSPRSGRATAACAGTRGARRRSGAISGMNCTALAPVPITATRLPCRSTSWSHRAEWNVGPANESRPSMSGKSGRLSWPTALMTAFGGDRLLAPVGDAARRRVHASSASDHVGRRAPRCRTRMSLAQAERVGAAPEVVEQHVLGREVQRPVVALRERVAVVVVRVVDAATGIRVLEPRAADVVVLLDDHERHAGLLQPVRGEQARHARADDRRRGTSVVGRDVGLAPPGRAAVLAADRELLFEEREVRGHVVAAADRVLHDPQEVGRRRAAAAGRQPPSRKRISVVERERRAPRPMLLVGQPALGHRRAAAGRAAGRRAAATGRR